MTKIDVKLSKPIAAGFTISECAKLYMYKFHELMTKELFPHNKINLCYIDTDSFIFEINTICMNNYKKNERIWLDTSNYPKTHPLYSTINTGIIGKFRDENVPYEDMPIEFIGLKSKMYSKQTYGGVANMRAKGAKSSCFSHEEYAKCSNERVSEECLLRNIRSYKHILYTTENRKNVLNSFDDIRHILQDGAMTLAHGHYSTLLSSD